MKATKKTIEAIRQAYLLQRSLMHKDLHDASSFEEHGWDLNFVILLSCGGGCIIRLSSRRPSRILDKDPNLANLLLAPYFTEAVYKAQANWRLVVSTAVNMGLPVPAFSSALAYFDSYRRETLCANMIQAQRDYFGAHTYNRIDKPGTFHTEWLSEEDEVTSDPV